MNLTEIFNFLKSHKNVALATVEEGYPKIRVFQIMGQEENVLYFSTSASKAVYRQLLKNPFVELLVWNENISVRMVGTVNFNMDDHTKKKIHTDNSVLQRLYDDYRKPVYFSLPISELDYYNLTLTPPVLEHFKF